MNHEPVVTWNSEFMVTTDASGDLQVAVEITGGSLDHPVECLVRRPRQSQILRLPAFRESASRFSRKIDGLKCVALADPGRASHQAHVPLG